MKLKLSPSMVSLAFKVFETPVEEMIFGGSRVPEYSFVLQKLIPKKASKVLDVGCTYRFNYVAPTLASIGWKVYGIDVREFKYKHQNFHFALGDITKTTFSDGCFDHIYMVSTIEHVGIQNKSYCISESDLNADVKAMKEIARILKPGGSLLLTTEYGRANNGPPFRVYDKMTIKRLLSQWIVEDEVYYLQNDAENWMVASEEKAAQVEGQPHAVVLLELSPRRE